MSATASGTLARLETPEKFSASAWMKSPLPEQLNQVRAWLEQAQTGKQKALLVSSVSAISQLLENPQVPKLLAQMASHSDVLFLLQDRSLPAALQNNAGVESYEAENLDVLMRENERFQQLVKQLPPVIMKEGYQNAKYVVLPENWISLTLYRIITLNPDLYRAAKNPAFLSLLSRFVSEIVSQELPKKSA